VILVYGKVATEMRSLAQRSVQVTNTSVCSIRVNVGVETRMGNMVRAQLAPVMQKTKVVG